jgi:hypothetical protein
VVGHDELVDAGPVGDARDVDERGEIVAEEARQPRNRHRDLHREARSFDR